MWGSVLRVIHILNNDPFITIVAAQAERRVDVCDIMALSKSDHKFNVSQKDSTSNL